MKVKDLPVGTKFSFIDDRANGEYVIIKEGVLKWNGGSDFTKHWENNTVKIISYAYPTSIEEAAKLLDLAKPGWQNEIKNLQMKYDNSCVLGQLYGQYSNGMKQLFGIDVKGVMSENTTDNILGIKASNQEWMKEINKRLTPVSKYMTFREALIEINKGNKVRRNPWDGELLQNVGQRLCYKNGDSVGILALEELANANDFVLVEEIPTLSKLKVGDKFKFEDTGPTFVVVDGNGVSKKKVTYLKIKNNELCGTDDSSLVIIQVKE